MQRQKFVRAAKWAFIESVAGSVLSFVSLLVVARLLKPSDFGVAAAVLITSGLVQTLTTQGMSDAMVRHRSGHTSITSAANSLALILGTCGWIFCLATAPLLALALDEPQLAPMLMVHSFTCVLAGLVVIPTARLTRKLRIKKLTFLNFTQKLFTTLSTIFLAFVGVGPWAIIVGSLIGAFYATGTFMAMSPQKKIFRVRISEALPLLQMSWQLGLEGVLWAVHVRVFALLFGFSHGPAELGYFNFGLRLVDEVANLLNRTISRIALSGFATAKRLGRDIGTLFVNGSFLTALVAYPTLIGIAIVAPDLIPMVFGHKWVPATSYVEVFCTVWCFTIVRVLAPPALRAQGVQRPLLIMAAIAAALNIAAVYATSSLPPEMAAWSFATRLLVTFPSSFYFVSLYLDISIRRQLMSLIGPVAATLAMALAVRMSGQLFPALIGISRLTLDVLVGMSVYCAVLLLLNGKQIRQLVRSRQAKT